MNAVHEGDCERRDSNPHGLPHWLLRPARLPVPPLSRGARHRAVRPGPGHAQPRPNRLAGEACAHLVRTLRRCSTTTVLAERIIAGIIAVASAAAPPGPRQSYALRS